MGDSEVTGAFEGDIRTVSHFPDAMSKNSSGLKKKKKVGDGVGEGGDGNKLKQSILLPTSTSSWTTLPRILCSQTRPCDRAPANGTRVGVIRQSSPGSFLILRL